MSIETSGPHAPAREPYPPVSAVTFGERVKRLRIERGLLQRDVAGEVMSTGYLSRLERGERQPTARVLRYLAERLGVSTEELLAAAPVGRPAVRELGEALALLESGTGNEAELIESIGALVSADPGADPELRWQVLWRSAKYYGDRGEYAAELDQLTRLVELGEEIAENRLRCRALTQLARCQLVLGATNDALACAEQAYELGGRSDIPTNDQVEALTVLVSVEAEAGRLAGALDHVKKLLDLVADAPALLRTRALWNAAMVHARAEESEVAVELLETALGILDAREDPVLWLRLRIATVSFSLQIQPVRIDWARRLLAEAKQALAFVGTPRHGQELTLVEARLAFETGEYALARELCDQLSGDGLLLGYRDLTRLRMLRGQLLIREGEREQGVRLLEELADDARRSLNVELAADIWGALARTLAADAR